MRIRIREQVKSMAMILGHDLIGLPEWRGVPIGIGQEVSQMILDQMMMLLDEILDLPPGKSMQEVKLIAHARKKVWILLRGGLAYQGRHGRKIDLPQA